MSGRAVREGFALPWNTTRSLADVWADEVLAARIKRRQDKERSYVREEARDVANAGNRVRYAGHDRMERA